MDAKTIIQAYQQVRNQTEALCKSLVVEDYVIQSIDDVSPPKWHLAHTTWFFETFILIPHKSYKPYNPVFHHLFNSYYQSIGSPYPRVRRGILSRPTVEQIYQYRHHVDAQLTTHIQHLSAESMNSILPTLILGLNHEQQHQELLLMDVKHNFSLDPSFPVYHEPHSTKMNAPIPMEFQIVNGGIVEIGHLNNEFCFDNELPRHEIILKPYTIANRLVTNAEYLEFIQAGGYEKPDWWLSDGWDCVQRNQWQAPLYWQHDHDKWSIFTLSGIQELNAAEPVSHISYYEADAYARWKNKRLPSEAEWENFVATKNIRTSDGNFMEKNFFHPIAIDKKSNQHQQFFGDLWEWTASAYLPYPGYKALEGALGEYNGKFMSNQFVLRGGSCVTPKSHIRASYRNFFQPDKRWQFSGIRLAETL
jgi:ergothioneine biosynthesis protein EgtB